MNAPSRDVTIWTVLALNACYLMLLGARVAASRMRRSTTVEAPMSTEQVAQRHVVSNQAAVALIAMSATAAVYGFSLLFWLSGSHILEPALIGPSWTLYGFGVALSVCGLALMSWTYAVFRSWRWRAEIEPGHRLMTSGPFHHVRHPIYLSFAMFYFGAFFLLPYAVFLLHAMASVAVYDYRARIEEAVMLDAFGENFRSYQNRTRRYLPGVY